MITKDEYLKALEVVTEYHDQLIKQANSILIKQSLIDIPDIKLDTIFSSRLSNALKSIECITLKDIVYNIKEGNRYLKDITRLRNVGKKYAIEFDEYILNNPQYFKN